MEEKTDKQYKKMVETPVPKLVVSLGIPTTISMLITNIYNMADTFFVGKLGTSASGAVGVVFALMAILQAFGFMFGHGAGSIISRSLGRKNEKKASEYASTSFFMAMAVGFIIAILGILLINPFMRLLGSTETILPYARTYAYFILIAAPTMVSSFVLNNILRYEGKAIFAMIGLTVGGLLNIAMDPIFMFVFNMGIAGAGLATGLSQIISFFILLSVFLTGKTKSKLSINHINKEAFSRIVPIVKNGFPSMVRQGLNSIANMILNQQAALYGGDAAVAAMSIVGRISMFIFAVGLGIGQGFQPVAAFNYGAKKYERVKNAFWFTTFLGEIVLGILAVVGLCIPHLAIAVFRNDREVINIGVAALRYQCIALFFQPICVCSNMLLQSVGESGKATITAMLRNGIYYIPLILVLPSLWGIAGIQITQMIADILSFITTVPIILSFLKKMDNMSKKEELSNVPKMAN